MLSRLLILLLAVLPKHLMSRAVGWLANRTISVGWRGAVYRGYCRLFGANAAEAALPLEAYASLNAFFTRSLKPGLRPLSPGVLVCPVDATVGACGAIVDDTLVQAKGRNYALTALLGDDALAARMAGGTYATLYLSPKDYHRFHAPIDALITGVTYIPGALWPVNAAAVAHVPDLFAVNERLVLVLERERGGVIAFVPVGATIVGMTRLTFDDVHTNARRGVLDVRRYAPPLRVTAGDELGHFEFGSTVVLVCSADCGVIDPFTIGATVRLGQRLGALAAELPIAGDRHSVT